MKKQPNVSVILPCFNETAVFDASVKLIVRTLSASRFSFELIFVDDGSSDGTRKLIKQACRTHPHCRYVIHEKNKGRGAAVTTGILHSNAPIVGYMDIDCEVSPLYIPSFVQMIKKREADIVVGKRIYRTTLFSLVREALSVGYRIIARVFLQTGGIDTESGYKFFDKKKFLPVLSSIVNQGWFWDTECVALSQKKGLRVVETPVLFVRRNDKHSSVRIIPDTLEYLKNVWTFYRRIRKNII